MTATHTYATPNVGDYQMAIVAYGQDSSGDDVSYILPHQDVAVTPVAVTDVGDIGSIAGEIELTWTDDSQVVTGYAVTTTPENGGAPITQDFAPDVASDSFAELLPGQEYDFDVAADNTLADGTSSLSTIPLNQQTH